MAAIYKFTGYRVSGKLVTSHHQGGGVIVHRCFLYELCYVHRCFVQSVAKYNLYFVFGFTSQWHTLHRCWKNSKATSIAVYF